MLTFITNHVGAFAAQIGLTSATVVALGWAWGKLFGNEWIKARFGKDLAAFTAEKTAELESFKADRQADLENLNQIRPISSMPCVAPTPRNSRLRSIGSSA